MGTPFEALGRDRGRSGGGRGGARSSMLLMIMTMALIAAMAPTGAPSATAQTVTDPGIDAETTAETNPSAPTSSSAPTSLVAPGPSTTLPCIVGVPPGYVEFVGIAGRPSQTTVQFTVTQPMTGTVERGPLVVALPDHAHFIRATKSYLVRAWMSDGRLVAYLTTNDCGRPRTTLADGTAVDTALLAPLMRKTGLVALGAFGTLATIALLIFLLGRIRVYGPERARIVDDPRYRNAFRPRRQRRDASRRN